MDKLTASWLEEGCGLGHCGVFSNLLVEMCGRLSHLFLLLFPSSARGRGDLGRSGSSAGQWRCWGPPCLRAGTQMGTGAARCGPGGHSSVHQAGVRAAKWRYGPKIWGRTKMGCHKPCLHSPLSSLSKGGWIFNLLNSNCV